MGRFLGGIFGNTQAATSGAPAISGVFDLNGQYYMKQEGGWTVPFSASGGDATFTYNSKKIHKFTTPGTLTVNSGSATCEYIVIGGGGSGGGDVSSGGAGGTGGSGVVIIRYKFQ